MFSVGCSNISHKNNFRKIFVFKKHLNVAKLFECGFLSSLKHLNIFLAGIGGACVTFRIRFRLWEMTFSFFPFLIYPMQKSSRFCLLINFSCFSKEQARSPPKKKLFRRRRLYISPVKKKGIRISILFWGVNSVGKSKWVPSSSFLPLSFLPIHMAHKGASHTLAQDTSLPTFSHSRRGLRTVIVVFVVVVSTGFRGHMDKYNYSVAKQNVENFQV